MKHILAIASALIITAPILYARADDVQRPAEKELQAMQEAFSKRATAEKIALYNEGIEAVRATGIERNAIQVGAEAPDFTLPDSMGGDVTLSNILTEGPAVVVWYRGGWCPYCNIYLRHMQTILPELEEAGARLIAISPERPDKVAMTRDTNQLTFAALSDAGNKVAASYGVVYDLPADIAASYKQAFDLAEYNGDDSYRLPLAATYVIDGNGVARYAFLDADYRNRAEPSEVLAAVRALAIDDAEAAEGEPLSDNE